MPVIEGLVDNQGNVVRMRGVFQVVSKGGGILEVEYPGQDVSTAFVLATAWRNDGDIGTANAAIAVSPRPGVPENIVFAVDDYYGLTFRVDSDDEVSAQAEVKGGCLPCVGVETRDWYAWINLMPPAPDDFHVVGEVLVPNPGVDPVLSPRVPQGINPAILLLDLHLIRQPGIWPQVLVWKPVRYDKVVSGKQYTQVQVFCADQIIADLPVEVVH